MKILTQLNTSFESILLIDESTTISKNLVNKLNLTLNSNPNEVILINSFIQYDEIIKSLSLTNNDLVLKLKVLNKEFQLNDLLTLGRLQVKNIVDRVFLLNLNNNEELINNIFNICIENRIPINTFNSSKFSTFTLLSTYNNENLQIGITTNLQGCKMSSRLKREIIKSIPSNINEIIENVSNLRKLINSNENLNKREKLKWLSQIIDYYPLNELGKISIDKLNDDLNDLEFNNNNNDKNNNLIKDKGKISLIGSGPGSILNLTIGALDAIYEADLILADKLVPQEILDLIPKSAEIFIARKFPGNADNAQEELLKIGLKSLEKGLNVVRLKQGDPYIFGRGGEEYLFFQEHGYKVNVLCGLSSAFVATANAGIPTTHRGVADQVMICTGVGRHGKIPDNLPIYEPKRTVIYLMSIKRIVDILPILVVEKQWPKELPVAIVERASCGDERVIRTRLGNLADVCKKIESRPPGLIVTGWACDVYTKLNDDEEYRIIETGDSISENVNLEKIVTLIK
jgi:uroporphyrin-III C-methyltransferase